MGVIFTIHNFFFNIRLSGRQKYLKKIYTNTLMHTHTRCDLLQQATLENIVYDFLCSHTSFTPCCSTLKTDLFLNVLSLHVTGHIKISMIFLHAMWKWQILAHCAREGMNLGSGYNFISKINFCFHNGLSDFLGQHP